MGNCVEKQQQQQQNHHHHHIITPTKHHLPQITPPSPFTTTAQPSPPPPPAPEATLCGDPSLPSTYYLRFALNYKTPLTVRFFPSQMPLSLFTLRLDDDDPVSGTPDTVLRYVESKLPHPPLLRHPKAVDVGGGGGEGVSVGVVRMAEIQHKSMRWHIERVVRWGLDLKKRGGRAAGDPSVGTPKMEVGKFGKSYGMLLEVLLEHAQMEERVIFPVLQAADRGICRCVNEEHARDLPIMNGIKEDIKSIIVLETGTPIHREALHSLSARLETLQENCREHFEEEERNLFTLMEATDLSREQQRKVVEQCIDVMQATHSHLFRFLLEGLLPHEAMEYLELVMNYVDKEKATSVLRILVD